MSNLTWEQMKQVQGQNNWKAVEDKIRELKKEELRKQVKGFLEWLKGQGIV